MNGLILTLVVGLFIFIGSLITILYKHKESFINFSISLALGIIIPLIIFELIPHSYSILNLNSVYKKIIVSSLFIIIGIIILKAIDLISPHEHEHSHKKNLEHISLVLGFGLILHNIVEGVAIYVTSIDSFSNGILMCVGVGLHNLPLGMAIASTYYENSKSKSKTIIYSIFISLSTFFGGLLSHLFKTDINTNIVSYISFITIGMLVYISFFELLPKFKKQSKKRIMLFGLIIGIIIVLLSHLTHLH